MANSQEPLTPATSDWQKSKAAIEVHNLQVDFEKNLRRCMEAVEVLLTRTEATHKELRGVKTKLTEMKDALPALTGKKG